MKSIVIPHEPPALSRKYMSQPSAHITNIKMRISPLHYADRKNIITKNKVRIVTMQRKDSNDARGRIVKDTE